MENSIIVNNDKLAWFDGMTVQDVLDLKKYTFKMLVVKINGKLVKKSDYRTTLVPNGADVKVIHLMSGG